MTPAERQLLAAVCRWARVAGWKYEMPGWSDGRGRDATIRVCWADGLVTVTRQNAAGRFPADSDVYPVYTIQQAVDVLVAVGVLPVAFSSAYRFGRKDWLETAEVSA